MEDHRFEEIDLDLRRSELRYHNDDQTAVRIQNSPTNYRSHAQPEQILSR
jgi:hypothetical protein